MIKALVVVKKTISDENLSTVLTDALVGSMFNEENEPRNRTLSVEQQQLQEQMKRSNLDAVEEGKYNIFYQ